MKAKIILILLGLALMLASLFTFVVSDKDYAIKFRFGEIVKSDFQPGLHWRIPGVNTIKKYDRRIQTLDNKPEPVLNTDNEYLMVDYFVKWRIKDPRKFYTSFKGDPSRVDRMLTDIIQNALLEEFSRRTLQQVISDQRTEIMQHLKEQTKQIAEDYGIEIVDVRIKRINLADTVSDSVYNRMRSERLAEAAEHRSTGRKEALNIRANTDKKIRILLAEADKKAAQMQGEGDAQATAIYAQAHRKDPEFFAFLRSLEAYRKSLSDSNSILVLEPDSEYFRYFKNANEKDQKGHQ